MLILVILLVYSLFAKPANAKGILEFMTSTTIQILSVVSLTSLFVLRIFWEALDKHEATSNQLEQFQSTTEPLEIIVRNGTSWIGDTVLLMQVGVRNNSTCRNADNIELSVFHIGDGKIDEPLRAPYPHCVGKIASLNPTTETYFDLFYGMLCVGKQLNSITPATTNL